MINYMQRRLRGRQFSGLVYGACKEAKPQLTKPLMSLVVGGRTEKRPE